MKPMKNRILAWKQNAIDDAALAGTHIYFWHMYCSGKLPKLNGDDREDVGELAFQFRRARLMQNAIIDSELHKDCEGR